jgi:hypothetical protein
MSNAKPPTVQDSKTTNRFHVTVLHSCCNDIASKDTGENWICRYSRIRNIGIWTAISSSEKKPEETR